MALVTLPSVPAELEAAFINDEFIEGLIKDIREKASSVVGDLNTVKGRRAYISMAANVRSTKTAIDDAGKKLVAEMKKRPALVDASRKKVRDSLDELAVEIRKPVTDWEAEQERIKAEEEMNAMHAEALVMNENIDLQRAIQYESGHEMALLMNEKIDREREEARQKAEQAKREHEERIKREAEEKARREADEAAKREIEAAAAREREATLAKERAERERIESEQRAEREKKEAAEKAERDKQQAIAEEQRKAHEEAERIKRENEQKEQARLAEEKRIKDEEARRADNIAHQKKINNAAMAILMSTGLSEAVARECVCAIVKNQKALAASGQRPPISINY
ncbi:cell envelope biogenesis protein TolA [Hafnia alvei]|nr:cell envelope biogenesis protein TolA [Hafnia alvei]PNL03829.1 cell envelope biogenesis protein TolA [Hafnia alvei]